VQYAYVHTNLVDLRSDPSHQSERLSQLFFGDTVELAEEQSGFARIKQADGYTGWVDSRYLTAITAQQALAYRTKLNGVVVAPQAAVSDLKGKESIPPHFLYYGTFVHISSKRESGMVISTPDLSRWLIKGSAVRGLGSKAPSAPTGAQIIKEAKRFLGVPYLWGGISPAGFDCSGLVRTIFGRYGLYLPRDTKDQIGVGRHIERSDARTGDLLFFKRHVGFAIGSDRLIHASRGGSGVRINSLVAGEKDYRPDLDRDFQEARRVLK
jgi:hypothetical protein